MSHTVALGDISIHYQEHRLFNIFWVYPIFTILLHSWIMSNKCTLLQFNFACFVEIISLFKKWNRKFCDPFLGVVDQNKKQFYHQHYSSIPPYLSSIFLHVPFIPFSSTSLSSFVSCFSPCPARLGDLRHFSNTSSSGARADKCDGSH